MTDTFETFIASERSRLATAREAALQKLQEAQGELQGIENELRAISAYEAAKQGKLSLTEPTPRRRSGGRKGGKRESILALIKEVPDGLSRGDILDKLNLKGDKSGEQSVSNALSALKKAGQLDTKDGKYVAP